VDIPNWPGIHDAVYLYKRRSPSLPPAITRRSNPHLLSSD
jgi:hypothetical protein